MESARAETAEPAPGSPVCVDVDLLRAVMRPAGPRADAAGMDGVARVLLDALLRGVQSHGAELLGTAVAIASRMEVEDESFVPLRDEVFALVLERVVEGEGPRGYVLTLDLPAARAIVDALERRLAGLRGMGQLTDAELGLLEFVSLELLERSAREVAGLDGELRVRSFHSGQEVRQQLQTGSLEARMGFRVTVGSQAGVAVLWAPEVDAAPAVVVRSPRPPRTDHVWVALVLPRIEVDVAAAGE